MISAVSFPVIYLLQFYSQAQPLDRIAASKIRQYRVHYCPIAIGQYTQQLSSKLESLCLQDHNMGIGGTYAHNIGIISKVKMYIVIIFAEQVGLMKKTCHLCSIFHRKGRQEDLPAL